MEIREVPFSNHMLYVLVLLLRGVENGCCAVLGSNLFNLLSLLGADVVELLYVLLTGIDLTPHPVADILLLQLDEKVGDRYGAVFLH